MKEATEVILFAIVSFVVMFSVVAASVNFIDKYKCSKYSIITGIDTKYTSVFSGGCYFKTNENWERLRYKRVVTNEN